MIGWPSPENSLDIRYTSVVLEGLAELALSGFRLYPWGGVEVGGVLYGTNDAEGVQILAWRAYECQHEYGPSFELSALDLELFERFLASDVEDQNIGRLIPVGWFHSSSKVGLGLSEADRKLHDRFFPHPWQIAMVLKRSKTDPLRVELFHRDNHGALKAHSPQREFELVDFRLAPNAPVVTEGIAAPPGAIAAAAEAAIPGNSMDADDAPPAGTSADEPALDTSPAQVPSFADDNPYAFLGLREDPFSPNPDIRYFYPSSQHRDAVAILQHAVQSRRGFSALIGESGTGKNVVLELVVQHLKAQSVEFGLLFNSKITPPEFFELLAHDLALECERPTKTAVLIALNEYLLTRMQAGLTTALIVDNAQKLSDDVLEEIELLGNLENRTGRLLQVIFAGDPSFARQLEKPEHRGLRQRIVSRVQLFPFNVSDTQSYIKWRLSKAGLPQQSIFPAELFSQIHVRTRGVPRLINVLCNGILEMCWEQRRDTADLEMLNTVATDLDLDQLAAEDPVLPNVKGIPLASNEW